MTSDNHVIHSDQNDVATWTISLAQEDDGKWYVARIRSKMKAPEFDYRLRGKDMERVWFQSRAVFLGYTAGTNTGSIGLSYSEVF